MKCRNLIGDGNGYLECKKGGCCPFQYWCNKDKIYKSTATKNKCKYYEESEDSNKK